MYIFKYILVIFCFWKYIFTFTGSKQQTCKHSKLITGLGSLPTGRGLAVISVRCWECDKKMTENWYNKFWHIILVTSHNVFMSYSALRGIFQLYLVINIGWVGLLGEVSAVFWISPSSDRLAWDNRSPEVEDDWPGHPRPLIALSHKDVSDCLPTLITLPAADISTTTNRMLPLFTFKHYCLLPTLLLSNSRWNNCVRRFQNYFWKKLIFELFDILHLSNSYHELSTAVET